MHEEPNAKSVESWVPWLLALALVFQAVFLFQFMGACAGGADSSGYLNSAKLLARGEYSTALRPVPEINARTLHDYTDHSRELAATSTRSSRLHRCHVAFDFTRSESPRGYARRGDCGASY
jgi:hypothetical protein